MNQPTDEKAAYDALVYWRNRIYEERAEFQREEKLPIDMHRLIEIDLDHIFNRLDREIAKREKTMKTTS